MGMVNISTEKAHSISSSNGKCLALHVQFQHFNSSYVILWHPDFPGIFAGYSENSQKKKDIGFPIENQHFRES